MKKVEEVRKESVQQLEMAQRERLNKQKEVAMNENIILKEDTSIVKIISASLDVLVAQLKKQEQGLQGMFLELKGFEEKLIKQYYYLGV